MALYIFGQGANEDPVDLRQIDLNVSGSTSYSIPIFIGFSYWTEVPDLLAGGFSMSVNYIDPTNTLRTYDGSVLNLQDVSSFISMPVQTIVRLDLLSRVTLDWSCPVPGSAKIGWRLLMSGNIDEVTQGGLG